MSITTTFNPPQPSDSPAVFNSKAFSTLGGLNTWSGEANALAEAVNADVDTATAKASEASESASSALTAKNAAEAAQEGVSASALIATTKATEAEESAADALTAKNAAEAAAVASSGKVNIVDPTTSGTLTHSGDVLLSGTGKRFTGDFNNAISANRLAFMSSAAGFTVPSIIANATAAAPANAGLNLYNQNDFTNGTLAQFIALTTEVHIGAASYGTGTFLPMTFHTGGVERMRIDAAGLILATNSTGLGYGAYSGGTVTQATSKTTPVTLNKACGQITMNNASLAAGAVVAFSFFTSAASSIADQLIVSGYNSVAQDRYNIWSASNGPDRFVIYVRNISAGALAEAVVINFAILKGSLT